MDNVFEVINARERKIVVAGHMKFGTAFDETDRKHISSYPIAFIKEMESAKNNQDLGCVIR